MVRGEIIKPYFVFALCLLFIASVPTGCGSSKANLKTILSEEIIEERLAILDSRFSTEELCQDLAIAADLLRRVQRVPISQMKINCPDSYRSFARELRGIVDSSGDLHTRVEFGFGLDAKVSPVVERCTGSESCTDAIGSPLLWIPGLTGESIYFGLLNSSGESHYYKLISLNGTHAASLMDTFERESDLSYSAEGRKILASARLFSRSLFDSLDIDEYEIEAVGIHSERRIRISASLDAKQTLFSGESEVRKFQLLTPYELGCVKEIQGSDEVLGACITNGNEPVIWIRSFYADGTFEQRAAHILDQLSTIIAVEKFIRGKIDLRGNTGGSTNAALSILRKMLNQDHYDRIQKVKYRVSTWPEEIEMENGERSIAVSSLEKSQNLDLIRYSNEDSSTYELGFFDRFPESTPEEKELKESSFAKMKWEVLTRGDEFSAAEVFVYLLSLREGIDIVGRTTRGGTGNPTWVTLPGTGARLRISNARIYDEMVNEEIIEKKGVSPQRVSGWMSESEFRSLLVRNQTN